MVMKRVIYVKRVKKNSKVRHLMPVRTKFASIKNSRMIGQLQKVAQCRTWLTFLQGKGSLGPSLHSPIVTVIQQNPCKLTEHRRGLLLPVSRIQNLDCHQRAPLKDQNQIPCRPCFHQRECYEQQDPESNQIGTNIKLLVLVFPNT